MELQNTINKGLTQLVANRSKRHGGEEGVIYQAKHNKCSLARIKWVLDSSKEHVCPSKASGAHHTQHFGALFAMHVALGV